MTSTLKHAAQKHIVTYGNLGFASAVGSPPLFTVSGKRIVYNVAPGQMVKYVVEDHVSRIVDTLTAADIYSLYVGVGIDETGEGRTTSIRHLGVEEISGCLPYEVSTSSPRCGAPQILDFYFDCTKCDETYSVEVTVDDGYTRSFGPWMKSMAQYVGSIVTSCSSCDDCDVEHNCKEVACKLADALNSDIDLRIGDKNYPDWKGSGLPRPYYATRLHATSKTYCFAPQTVEDSCTACTYVAAVEGVRIRDTRYPFTGNLNPINSAQTLTAQIGIIGEQINEFFKTEYGEFAHAGSSYTTGSFSDCCPIQLHINTCDASFALYDANDAEIAPLVSNNPFTEYGTVAGVATCVDCADLSVAAIATLTFTGQPANTETVVVNGRTYTFQTVLTNVNGNVLIGATTAASLANLVAAVNLGAGVGTTYAAATVIHATVSAADSTGTTIVFTAKTAGTAGNSFGSTDTVTNASFGAATFAGGTAGTDPAATVYPCGIRVIAERIKGDCGCYIQFPLSFYGRKLTINPIGPGFRGKPWKVIEVQAMELPAGFGAWIQYLEYQTLPEGTGRRYSRSNHNRGTFALPDKTSRVNAVTALCTTNYCSYYLKWLAPVKPHTMSRDTLNIHSTIHIPAGDATTVAAWEAFETALLALNPSCKPLTAVACDTDLGVCA